jgi:predicted HAD superfamily phosphohydrolase YqeG
MHYFTKAKKWGLFHPNYVASDVLDINYKELANQGITTVAFDVDGTLTINGSHDIDTNRATMLTKLLNEAGIQKRYLASNSIRNLDNIINKLPGFATHQPYEYAGKPSRRYFNELIKKSGSQANNIAFVGDRGIQDVFGPKRVGITTILVETPPEYCNLQDKIFLRHLLQRHLVRLKITK